MNKGVKESKGEFQFNSENSTEFFNKYFLPALHHGEIYYEERTKSIVFKTSSFSVKANMKIFKLIYTPSFENIFQDIVSKLSSNATPENIINFLEWNNQIFDIIEIEAKTKATKNISKKFDEESKGYSEEFVSDFRDSLPRALIAIDEGKRNEVMDKLLSLGMIHKEDLIDLGYYRHISVDKLLKMAQDNEISEDDLQNIAYLGLLEETVKSDKTSSKKKKFIGILDKSKVIDLFFNGYITENDLKTSNIRKEDLFNLSYETLISILEDKDILPKHLQITSKDIINQYGKRVTGTVLYKLIMYGYVNEDDVIDIIGINKVLKMTDYDEEKMYDDSEVMAFYSPDRLVSMLYRGKLTPEFLEKYTGKYLSSNNSKVLDDKSRVMLEKLKYHVEKDKTIPENEKESKIQTAGMKLYNIEICTKDVYKEFVTSEFLEEQYLSGVIGTKDIISLYKDGIISEEMFEGYFSEEDIFNMYLNSELQLSILCIIKDKKQLYDNIEIAYLEDKMPIEDILSLYFSFNMLSVEELSEIIKLAPDDLDISEYITEETGFKKIKELFENYLIDYSAITVLKDQGIITQEEFKTIRETIDKNEFFNSLKGQIFKVVTTREKNRKSRNSSSSIDESTIPPEKKDDFDSEKLLISSLLKTEDIEGKTADVGIIESYNKNGHPTTLNGYKVLGNKDNGLVIFSKFEKGNAVFVMPFYQAAYFLRGNSSSDRGENGEVEISDRMKDKAYLKTLSQVKVISHTEFFARNLVDASCDLSDELAEEVRTEDGYIKEVQEYINLMRNEYRQAKGLPEIELE